MVEQFLDAHLFHCIVLDDQEPLAARFGVFLDLGQCRGDAFGGRRFVDEGEGAARQRVLAVFVERDDLDRNVPRQRIMLELAQHRPAEHIGQKDVERYGGRLILLGEIQRFCASCRDQNLETLVAGQVYQHPRIMRIVLDDQKNGVAGFEAQPIVRQLLDDPLLCDDGHRRRHAVTRRCADARRDRRAGILQRQIECEDAALAGGALQMDLAAEQACELAADGKAKAGAAVFSAGAGIRLLERFEDQLLLVLGNADAGVGYFEGDHRGRVIENGMFGAPAADRGRDTEAHATFGGELEGVGEQVLQHLLQSLRVE